MMFGISPSKCSSPSRKSEAAGRPAPSSASPLYNSDRARSASPISDAPRRTSKLNNSSCQRSSSFLDLPIELRTHVYSYLFQYHPPNPKSCQIELLDERWFNGSPAHICLVLGWQFLLLNRQVAREGVEYAFRWTDVRLIGGPWVIWRTLSKIGTYLDHGQKLQTLSGNVKGKERACTSTLPSQLLQSDDSARVPYHPPYYANPSNPLPTIRSCSPPTTASSPLLSRLTAITLLWPSFPHDIHCDGVLPRISTFELQPLFALISHLPSLTQITTLLRFRSARDPFAVSRREYFNIELTSFALALLLLPNTSVQKVQIRYGARNSWAAMEPGIPFSSVVSRGVWNILKEGELRELASAITGVKEWAFEIREDILDIAVDITKWDPITMTDMVGNELLLTATLKTPSESSLTGNRKTPREGVRALTRSWTWSKSPLDRTALRDQETNLHAFQAFNWAHTARWPHDLDPVDADSREDTPPRVADVGLEEAGVAATTEELERYGEWLREQRGGHDEEYVLDCDGYVDWGDQQGDEVDEDWDQMMGEDEDMNEIEDGF